VSDYQKEASKFHDALEHDEFERALSILIPFVEKGDPDAIGQLGVMYQLGYGVPRNLSKAVEILTRSYELGNGTAAHNLGTIYAMGEEEISKDRAKSRMYYNKAKSMGAQFAPDEFYV